MEAGVIEVVESFGPVAPLDDPAAESSSIGWDVRCAAASSSAPADGAAVGWDACIDVGSCVTDDAGPSMLDA